MTEMNIWQRQCAPERKKVGPLIPSVYQIRDPRKQYSIKREICRYWEIPRTTRSTNPAPQPISLERQDLGRFQRGRATRYAVSEKTRWS